MAKVGPPRIANPAAPKRILTSHEAEAALTQTEATVTNDSDTTAEEQAIMDEVFGGEGEGQDEEYDVHDDEPSEGEDEIVDKPTRPAKHVPAKGSGKAGDNLSGEQKKYWDEIGELGTQQGKGVSSLISLAEKMVTIGHLGTFSTSQIKDLYMHFRANSNTAAGKNREFGLGADDHTVVANTSKLRTFYKVGEKFGIEGWSKMLKVARDIHVNILRSKDERKNLRSKQLVPTYEALVKVASTQMKKEKDAKGIAHDVYPNLLTADQIRDVFIDPNKQETEPSVTDVIKAAVKAIERVIRGKTNAATGETTREAFDAPADGEDDQSVGAALVSSLTWMLEAGERYETGFKANLAKEQAEAKAAAEERHRKHQERMAREEAERAERQRRKEEAKKAKEAEEALAKEGAAAK